MKLVISREKWLRGVSESFLLHPKNDKMCCLGFYARECGLGADEIRGLFTPEDVSRERAFDQKGMVKTDCAHRIVDSDLAYSLMNANDARELTDAQRELRITDLFKEIGVEVEFVA